MSRKTLERAFFDLDAIRLRADTFGNVLKAVLDDGDPRPKLLAEERATVLAGLEQIAEHVADARAMLTKKS